MSSSSIPAFGLELSHSDQRSRWQYQQFPHEMSNGTTTRSPLRRLVTPRPTSSTIPMNSCPITSPFFIDGTLPP